MNRALVRALVAAVIFLGCTADYNPFQHYNANAYVLSWPFDSEESVYIFSTDTIAVIPTVYEKIDSIQVVAPCNRFGEDTTIVPKDDLPVDTIFFPVSFYKTGRFDVAVHTFRSNGKIVSQTRSYRVSSPLNPRSIIGQFGLETHLTIDSVRDTDVLYHWDFGSGRKFESIKNQTTVKIYTGASSGTGNLWVTDQTSEHMSPAQSFKFDFNDTVAPIIECMNDSLRGDTIICGDSLFVFKALIYDKNQSELSLTSINGEQFTTQLPQQNLFIKKMGDITGYSSDKPLTVTVEAKDDPLFNNYSKKVFHVIYDKTIPRSVGTTIEFISPAENAFISTNNFMQIIGRSIDYSGNDIILSLTVNDSLYPQTFTLNGDESEWEQWSWDIFLPRSIDTVTVTARDANSGEVTGSESRRIIYDASTVDDRRPIIWEVSSDGKPVDGLVVDSSRLSFEIISFDEGSGIQLLVVEGKTLYPQDNEPYVWEHTTELEHNIEGNELRIIATDRAGNISEKKVTIFYNRAPYFAVAPNIPKVFYVDSTYDYAFKVSDPDGDEVRVYPQPLGPIDASNVTNSSISWTPTMEDIGKDTLILVLDDGFKNRKLVSWPITVANRDNIIASPRFANDSIDIPTVLQSQKDSLSFKLHIVEETGEAPLVFSCFVGDSILFSGSSIDSVFWKPESVDTGRLKFTAIVSDAFYRTDTLIEFINVVPRNQHPVKISLNHDIPLTEEGALNMSEAVSSQIIKFFITDKDHPLTEQYALQIRRGGITTYDTLDSARSFQIEIDNSSDRDLDTLFVSVADKTSLLNGEIATKVIPMDFRKFSLVDLSGLVAQMNAEQGITTFYSYLNTWESTNGTFTLRALTGFWPSISTDESIGHDVVVFSSAANRGNGTFLGSIQGNDWEKKPFTIYAVVKFSRISTSPQVIVSSGDDDNFQLGVTCQGNIGIFNENPHGCDASETVDSDLQVEADQWYIISYMSETGIVDENIEVSVRRNGKDGSEILTMNGADPGSTFIIGAGDAVDETPNSILNGSIAEILYIESTVSAYERREIESYLSETFDITLQ